VLQLLKTLLPQELDRLGAAHAALAVDDHLLVWVQLAEALRELRQRHQHAAWNAANLVFLRIADIEDKHLLAAVEAAFQFLYRGFPRAIRRRGSRRLLAADAAELVVVDQLGDRRLVAAHRALWIAADFEFLEGHLQGVVKQQPANERGAFAKNQLHRLRRLDAADQARQNAQHSALRAARHFAGRRRLRI